ncbi:MAG: plasmid pRiA4b ORF-3 family protein [Streptosporangiales bacterium]|nr:plasmid pRiA4b ORF-3 family protein [Streptosporangiales bacterium]
MPKISGSADDVLRMVLEGGGDALDDRLRNILASQVDTGPERAGRSQPLPLPDSAATTIHRVKVSLHGAKPPVWRRLELPSDMRLDLVHETLQTAFGWFDCHYHQFETDCGEYGDPAQNADTWRDDESVVALVQVAADPKTTVGYVYDFGDNWRHDLVVEAVSPAEPGVRYPRCTAGRGLAPDEDSGGIRTHNETGSRGSVTVDPEELTSALRGLSSVIVPAP